MTDNCLNGDAVLVSLATRFPWRFLRRAWAIFISQYAIYQKSTALEKDSLISKQDHRQGMALGMPAQMAPAADSAMHGR
ncbi:hypothetical protein ACW4YW_05030 [Methylobacillus pratensis]